MSEKWLKRLMPYPSRYVDIDGHKMHYIDVGEGPTVVLLHGNPTWCFFFRHLIGELKQHFRVIAPDHLGMGLSDHPVGVRFRATDRIDHLESLFDTLGIEKFSLVMHDWGGAIGTGLATRRTDQVERLLYLNTTLTETESLPLIIKAAANRVTGKFLTKFSKQFLRFTTNLGVVHKLPRDVKRAYWYPYKTMARRSAIWDFVDDIPFDSSHPSYSAMLDLAKDIPALSEVPVKIVWGLRDPCFHREMLTKVSQHFPHANVVEIPDASHLLLEDAPDVCNSEIKEFLLGNEGPVEAVSNEVPLNDEVNALVKSFWEHSAKAPNAEAVVEPVFIGDAVKYGQMRYRDCYSLLNKYQRGLMKLGLTAGDRVIMLVTPGRDFLMLAYAVMARGAVPVFLDPGMGKDRLLKSLESVKADAFIGSPKALLLKLAKRKLFKSFKFVVCAAEWGPPGTNSLSYLKKFAARPVAPAPQGELALLAFTSGATGSPKGVMYTNDMLRAQLKIFSEQFGMEAGQKDMPLLPLFSIFSLALGVCSVFPGINQAKPLSLDPKRIVRVIKDQQLNSSFGSPTLWKKIAEYCVRSRNELHELNRVFIAGAPVSEETLLQVTEILPNGEAFTPYGATEALPVTMVSAHEIRETVHAVALTGEQGTLIGRPVVGVQARVVKAFDQGVKFVELQDCEDGEVGELLVCGDNVSKEYFQRPDANVLAKLEDPKGAIWHRMGDMVYRSEAGDFYFCGRKVHAVPATHGRLFSVPVEQIFNQHAQVRRSALVFLPSEGIPAVVIEPLPQFFPQNESERLAFEEELRALAKTNRVTADLTAFFFHESFPVDGRHNAKIYRDQLGEWADRQPRFQVAA